MFLPLNCARCCTCCHEFHLYQCCQADELGKTHQQSVNPRSENICWVGLQVTECTSSSISVSVGTFDIDLRACDFKFLTLCFHSQLLLSMGAHFLFSGGRCIRWFSETLRKPQFPLRHADCLYTDVYLRAWTHGQTAFSQTVRLQHSCWQRLCHIVTQISGSPKWLHLQFSFHKGIFLWTFFTDPLEFFLMIIIISFNSVLYWFLLLFNIQESVKTRMDKGGWLIRQRGHWTWL